jgi:6-phosphogluconolactonase
MNDVQVFPDPDHLARAAAGLFTDRAQTAVAARGRFVVALSGGSTPTALYKLLATNEFSSQTDWKRIHVFWGDERCVPPDHPDSNYRLARQTLLDHVPIPAQNVHRVRGELEPAAAADEYAQEVRRFFGDAPAGPRFDLIFLGMGDNGHTASLFPGSPIVRETSRWVMACYVGILQAWRVTLTPVVINAAAEVVFLVSGEGKARTLRQVLAKPHRPDILPAQVVRPANGRLTWMVDAAAASQLG